MISAPGLAWLQLRRRKARFVVAIAGVVFAVVLMFLQVGFRDALFRSAVNLHKRLRADVVMLQTNYTVLPFPTTFARSRLFQALEFDGVRSVSPVYLGMSRWKNPVTGKVRDLLAIGIDPAQEVLDIPEVNEQRETIRYPDVVLYDELSRPEFGPIVASVRAGEEVATEVNQRRIAVAGLFALGTSFGIDGTLITSDLNFLRLFPNRTPGVVSLGLIRTEPGADTSAIRDGIAAYIPNDVEVLTAQEFIDREVDFWATATPIGYVFTLGAIMGLVVGAIVVYQILFADIIDHLPEYATLKAMGYANRYLAGVVLMESIILALSGFLPGLGVCSWLFDVTRSATKLPMELTAGRAALVLTLTTVMCAGSGLIALRRLRAADPAEVF